MSVSVLALVLGSAALHVAWNAAARAQEGRLRFMWLIMAGGGAAGFVAAIPWLGQLDLARVLPFVVATSILHAFYFTTLASAYRRAELAWAYTLSRAVSVLVTAALAALALGEHLTIAAWCGLAAVLAGSLLGAGGFGRPQALWRVALIGVLIAGYTLVDSTGVRIAPPVPYIALLFAGSALLVAPIALRQAPSPGDAKGLLYGAASLASYLLMLFAYRLGPAAPLLALRQAAPLLAALGGYVILREMPSRRLIGGIALVAFGAALFTLAPA